MNLSFFLYIEWFHIFQTCFGVLPYDYFSVYLKIKNDVQVNKNSNVNDERQTTIFRIFSYKNVMQITKIFINYKLAGSQCKIDGVAPLVVNPQ